MPCVYMISTSGVCLQGDRLDIDHRRRRRRHGARHHAVRHQDPPMDANSRVRRPRKSSLGENSYLELMPGA